MMAAPFSYGDSRTYFRTQALPPIENQTPLSPYWPASYTNVANQIMVHQMTAARNLAQNAMPPKEDVPPEPKSSSRVIADCGFGGAESKPRCRKYARPKTPATKAG